MGPISEMECRCEGGWVNGKMWQTSPRHVPLKWGIPRWLARDRHPPMILRSLDLPQNYRFPGAFHHFGLSACVKRLLIRGRWHAKKKLRDIPGESSVKYDPHEIGSPLPGVHYPRRWSFL